MAFIEFVDFDPTKQKKTSAKIKARDGQRKLIEKELTPAQFTVFQEKNTAKRALEKRKRMRKVNNASRAANR